MFDVTDETTGTALAPIDSVGQVLPPATVSVFLPVVDGHSYSWTVSATDGTNSSSAAGPCDFVSDTTAPLSPTVTSTDFPSSGSNLQSGQAGSFTLTSSDPKPAVGTESGLKGFSYVFDSTLSVGAPVVPANADGSLTISGESFGWGTHTLYAQAVDGAGNVSGVEIYSFYVPQNPELSPVLSLTAHDALSVEADGTASTALYGVASCSFDFGDGSAVVSNAGCTATHTYQKPGAYPVTLTISDGTNQKSVTEDFTTAGSDFTSYGPSRVLDTRHGTGAAKAKVAKGGHVTLKIAGDGSIPAGVTAVALNLTVTDTTGNGWVAAEPDGAGVPGSSSVNYLKGQTVSNTVIVPVAEDGNIELYNGGGTTSVDLIADITGYFAASAPDAYVPIAATRAVDTRKQANGALRSDAASEYAIGPGDEGIAAVIGNLTVTESTANGFLTAYPDGITRPGVSNLNYLTGQNIGDMAVLDTAVGNGQSVATDVYNSSTGTVQLIIDVFGYFETD